MQSSQHNPHLEEWRKWQLIEKIVVSINTVIEECTPLLNNDIDFFEVSRNTLFRQLSPWLDLISLLDIHHIKLLYFKIIISNFQIFNRMRLLVQDPLHNHFHNYLHNHSLQCEKYDCQYPGCFFIKLLIANWNCNWNVLVDYKVKRNYIYDFYESEAYKTKYQNKNQLVTQKEESSETEMDIFLNSLFCKCKNQEEEKHCDGSCKNKEK